MDKLVIILLILISGALGFLYFGVNTQMADLKQTVISTQPIINTQSCDLSIIEAKLNGLDDEENNTQSQVFVLASYMSKYPVDNFELWDAHFKSIDNSLVTLWGYTDLKNKGAMAGAYNSEGYMVIGSTEGISELKTCQVFLHELGHKVCYQNLKNYTESCAEEYKVKNLFRCEGLN